VSRAVSREAVDVNEEGEALLRLSGGAAE